MSGSEVTVMIRYQAQPGQGETARRELASLIATVVAQEPACLGIRMLQDADDDTRFLLVERWTDRAAYTGAHMQTPHIQAFIRQAPAFMAGPPVITFWNVAGDVSSGRDRRGG
jgi:quinol monooxygenase YgiN